MDSLVIGVGNAIDTAPLRIAVADGVFDRVGLRVELREVPNREKAVTALLDGELDIVSATNVALFSAIGDGTKLRIQGEAHIAGTDSMALVTLPGSDYTDLGQLPAPRIAVTSHDGLGVLTARSALDTAGVAPEEATFEAMPFDAMIGALEDGEVDAAWLVEPYITIAQKRYGARVLADCAHGATADFPMSGYATTAEFAERNPVTLEVFRDMLARAQQRGADTAAVRRALPGLAEHERIDEVTASLVSLGTYPQAANSERLQRVADLMHGSGLLRERLDVAALVPKGKVS